MKIKEPITIRELADLLSARLIGNGDAVVTGINEIHKVEKGDLTFVDYDKYYQRALTSPAAVVLMDKEPQVLNGKPILISKDPFTDYNKLVERYRPFEPAYKSIADTAEIGDGTHLQPGVFVGNNVRIGKNCLVHAHVSICDHTVIGDNVIIHPNAVIGSDAFYVKKRGDKQFYFEKMLSCGKVVIHNGVEIGAGCVIDRGVSGDTVIGEGTKMDNQVHVGHGTVIGKNCLFAAQVGIAGKVNIGDNVILWGQVGVSKDLDIGSNVIVLAQSGVGNSLEADKVYFGSPAREARKVWREMAMVSKLPDLWQDMLKNGQ